jgi:hypothetical protein
MFAQNGASPAHRLGGGRARRIVGTGERDGQTLRTLHSITQPIIAELASSVAGYSLHYGRSKKPILLILPERSGLYRIQWPDIGLSSSANLTRCKQAALEWAEHRWLTEHPNLSVAQRLKSLNNFWWSSSYVRQNRRRAA